VLGDRWAFGAVFGVLVPPPADLVDERLGDVLDGGEAAGQVAVQR
jgi:hypothetical protein